tara:strand:+ start:461 stop:838 length:378 start_codon:yes stop_codon:yes gene_type:complete
MNTKQTVLDKLFQNKTELSEKVELNAFASYEQDLKAVKDNFYVAANEMESIAIELEFKEKEMLDYRADYYNVLADYIVEVEEKLRELGVDGLPGDWSREFERLQNDIPQVESIKGIVDTVKTNFR